jgi:hypothetical protein
MQISNYAVEIPDIRAILYIDKGVINSIIVTIILIKSGGGNRPFDARQPGCQLRS